MRRRQEKEVVKEAGMGRGEGCRRGKGEAGRVKGEGGRKCKW